ncbi:WD domain-containing protein [Colletotrichum acutatum]|uniref:WD domain-containing protein n=1 Tax=Glomerella acutata TaxID=27357 RepID=A0AAD8XQR8_GLOAC|nr:WD domain-containing protein [Colletotrichum acutatum]KAK1731733.1 WD domain-containing protein [Colletotrichum acutatum]
MNRHHAQFVAGPLQRDHYFTPVTGLSFFNARDGETYLLAGEDTELKVYDGEGRLRCQLGIFHAQPIHGIHVAAAAAGHGERRHVLLWGNQAVTVVSAAVIEELILGSGGEDEAVVAATPVEIIEAKAPDWIYDGVICPEDPDRGVLITAHNEVLEFSVAADGKTISFGRIVSPSRPILYSANLTWLSETSVLVAGGTVFGEIIVWKCHFSSSDGAATASGEDAASMKPWCEALFVFTGHEGSIFGVDISREIDLGGGCTARLLASCSDDRTIRIWDITERPGSPRLQYDAFGEARETGFGGSSSSSAPAAAAAAATDLTTTQVASSAPLTMVMGHISRIWHVRFPLGGVDELARGRPVTVYSFGEDSTLQAWSLDVDLEAWRRRAAKSAATVEGCEAPIIAASITYKETYARHDGKHIWATAVTEEADGRVLIATGGADSKINLFSDRSRAAGGTGTGSGSDISTTASKLQELPSELQTLVMRDVVSKLAPRSPDHAIPLETKEAFQRFAFVYEDTIVATSTTGRLLVGSFGPELTWAQIGTDGETLRALNACTSLKSPAPGLALIGTANKKILLHRDSTIQQVGTVPGKVADIFPLRKSPAEDGGASDKKLEFLVTMLGSGDAMQILTLDLDAAAVTSMVPVPELDSRFVVTAACQINDLLVLGSRHGYVSVFRRVEDEQQLIPFPAPDRRSGDAITSINVLPTSSTSGAAASHIITTSRDGNYRVYETSDSAIQLRHETAPAAVPNLEDAWLSDNGDLILCGFRSKNFIVWNETRHEEILRVDCGGAHRAFAYTRQSHHDKNTDSDSNKDRVHGMRFVFNKAATLGVFTKHSPSVAATHHRTLKRGSHGREVRAIAYSGHSGRRRRYIATGSEDTSIRIWEYTTAAGATSSPDENRGLRCVKVVKVHTAGLQSLKWLGEDLLFSCSGNEEFMVWRACDLGDRGLGLMREAVFADKSEDGDLRITSFDVVALDNEKNGNVAVTMAFSNSFVKTYRYTPGLGFELLFQGQYTGACLTQARHLRVREGVFDVITAATDGCLAVWRSQGSEYVLRHTERIHQSSIKALDVHFTTDDRVVVLTGGDDNALGIVTLVSDSSSSSSSSSDADNMNDGGFENWTRAGVRKAHAAAINGLTVLGERGGRIDFVTVSNDQRVKMWRLGWREGVEEITLLADEYSGVADAGDIEIIGDGKVAVGGVGLEVWDWRS